MLSSLILNFVVDRNSSLATGLIWPRSFKQAKLLDRLRLGYLPFFARSTSIRITRIRYPFYLRALGFLSSGNAESSQRRGSKKGLDFRIKIPSDSKSLRVSIGRQETRHFVIC
jgi:hypothetical protein